MEHKLQHFDLITIKRLAKMIRKYEFIVDVFSPVLVLDKQ